MGIGPIIKGLKETDCFLSEVICFFLCFFFPIFLTPSMFLDNSAPISCIDFFIYPVIHCHFPPISAILYLQVTAMAEYIRKENYTMTDNEKRAHDIAIAAMQKNIKPVTDGEDFMQYVKSLTDFYFNVYNSAKIQIERH